MTRVEPSPSADSPTRDRIVVIALGLYVAVLAFGAAGVLLEVDWIQRLF
ncbi:MAG: hypothetical protein HYR85_13515 [Planctomycetes bacterium]|nr:hypothetical protein [Planctomycetota bacterium]MBI3846579.1 hypothetical protein [Planctomycetota bacterium]